ncbi:hypothetical protein BDR07DRAFT_1419473 [Suillus spraguei]|nr:hypothetical protein BDR07DRAFT_1419473 [Suillus spraguei]
MNETMQAIYVGFVGFTILIWDHLVTIGDEVELIWKGRKGIREWHRQYGYDLLKLHVYSQNRYLTPLGFIINLVAYNLPSWSHKHFVRYEGALTAIGIEIVGIMMLLRVVAMYKYQRAIILLAVLLLLAWTGVTAWLLSRAGRMFSPSSPCSMVFNSGNIASASAWLPLLYDTYVFGLTLNRTLPAIRNKEAGRVIRTLLADGLLYYSVICSVNLVLTIMIIKAPEGVQNIAAQLELLITLNIKKQAYYKPSPLHLQVDNIMMSTRNQTISTHSGGVRALSRAAVRDLARQVL